MRGRRADETTQAQWRQRIAEAARSGRSTRAFCREQGVTEGQFYAWRRRLNRQAQGTAPQRSRAAAEMTGATFALVHAATPPPEPAGVELVWADGRRLRIGPGVDAATLRTVLAVLEPARC